jgi:hypothetical protein
VRIPIVDVSRRHRRKLTLGLRKATATILLSCSVTVIVPGRDADQAGDTHHDFLELQVLALIALPAPPAWLVPGHRTVDRSALMRRAAPSCDE